MRARFFGPEASTAAPPSGCSTSSPEFRAVELDIRDADGVHAAFARARPRARARRPHRRAAVARLGRLDPHTDFGVNANGTLNLLENTN